MATMGSVAADNLVALREQFSLLHELVRTIEGKKRDEFQSRVRVLKDTADQLVKVKEDLQVCG